MSNTHATTDRTHATTDHRSETHSARRVSTETKHSLKTTELPIYVLAVLGVLIGGGGTIAATEGKEVELPQGAVLRVRVDSPLQLGTAR